MKKQYDIRISPDGERIARYIPERWQSEQDDKHYRWIAFYFHEGAGLTAERLTGEDVADWQTAFTEDNDG